MSYPHAIEPYSLPTEAVSKYRDDGDWASPLDETKINEFLRGEWKSIKKKKKAEVYLYRRLTTFLKEHFPKIDLRIEEEKQAKVEELFQSRSFSSTHRLIAELSKFELAFSPSQVDLLYAALLDNHQVGWIVGDVDVRKFYQDLYDFGMNFLNKRADEVRVLLDGAKERTTEAAEEDDEMPF
jgi:hypothetical protein